MEVSEMSSVSSGPLTRNDARKLTDEVRGDAQALWAKLLRLYEGGAHTILGYTSWEAYCGAEFDLGKSRSYQLLEAARVVDVIEARSTNVESPAPVPNEAVARELAPAMKEDPGSVPGLWEAIVNEHGVTPTAKEVKTHVRPDPEPTPVEPTPADPTPAPSLRAVPDPVPDRPSESGPVDALRKVAVASADMWRAFNQDDFEEHVSVGNRREEFLQTIDRVARRLADMRVMVENVPEPEPEPSEDR